MLPAAISNNASAAVLPGAIRYPDTSISKDLLSISMDIESKSFDMEVSG